MESIYIEAILFVAVFGGMSILSIIISKKHAANYVPEVIEELAPLDKKEQRINELLKLANKGVLTFEEFKILKEALNN